MTQQFLNASLHLFPLATHTVQFIVQLIDSAVEGGVFLLEFGRALLGFVTGRPCRFEFRFRGPEPLSQFAVFTAKRGDGLNSASNALYRNNGNSNNWIRVKCVGTLSNRSAIGAKMKVKATIRGSTFWQVRDVSGGSGYFSQNSLDVTIGLDDAGVSGFMRMSA